MLSVVGWQAFRSSHSATLVLAAPLDSTLLGKLLLNFSLLFAGLWPNDRWCSSVVWRCRSFVLAALHWVSGGATPDSVYIYSLCTGVGLRHTGTRWQVALMSGSIFLAWGDLSQTGHAYSAVEWQKANGSWAQGTWAGTPICSSEIADNVVSCTDFGFCLLDVGRERKATV